jgi:hypothetical protein
LGKITKAARDVYFSPTFKIVVEGRLFGKDSVPVTRWTGGDYIVDSDNIGRYLKFKKISKESNEDITVPINYTYNIAVALDKVYRVLSDPETFSINQEGLKIMDKEKLKESKSLIETPKAFENVVVRAGFDEQQMEGAYLSGEKIMIFIPWHELGKVKNSLKEAEDKLDKFILMDLIFNMVKR